MSSGRTYESELQNLRSQRDHIASALARVDREIGKTASKYLEEDFTSYSSAARLLGVSHTHVKALIERSAATEPTRSDPDWSVSIMSPWHATQHLLVTDTKITRVIAGYAASDVFHASQLEPRLFDQGPDCPLHVPHMLWQLNDRSWLGVDDVNVGYGGTGGANALRALRDAGIDEQTAKKIAYARFSDTDLVSNVIDATPTWPRYEVGLPRLVGNQLIVEIGQDTLVHRKESRDESGFYPSSSGRSPVLEWMDYLDKVQPLWADGPRIARVFLDRDTAVTQGFVRARQGVFGRGGTPFALIIEQGRLQIWIETYEPQDATQHLSKETYDALADAQMYPDELAEQDNRSRFWRLLHRQFGPVRPKWIDLSDTGERAISYVPSEAQEVPSND